MQASTLSAVDFRSFVLESEFVYVFFDRWMNFLTDVITYIY